MDTTKILNNLVFNYGWRVNSDFNLFGKLINVTFILDSYDENEIVNEKQEKCLKILEKEESTYSDTIITLVKQYINNNSISINISNIENELRLTSILITQDGDVIFLFEVTWDIENGLAIKVIPEFDIGSQDVFL